MIDKIEQQIKGLLAANKSKQGIWKELSPTIDQSKLIFHLNNLALPSRGAKVQYLVLGLAALLILITGRQLYAITIDSRIDLALFLGLIPPIIHIYLLREILLCHRTGFQFTAILSVLALLRPENRIGFEPWLYLILAALAGGLYYFLFPKKDNFIPPASSP
ncbi:MAG: hypothetical protein H8E79_08485 [Desulfobulbaceae bacterium]|uniref:Uncharacterized protein n=1 Tax=Candidatus Desulfatifera sulfidica TaxID=2841691 RepID=A0A8J6TD09_9BACT|nr:hypothetical protein [Candidatus Desulfatifera sulfidica]